MWQGLAVGVLAIFTAVYGTVVSGREQTARTTLARMQEGLSLLAVERDVSLSAHDLIASITMDMYAGAHEADVAEHREAFRRRVAAASAQLSSSAPSETWRSIHREMGRAAGRLLSSFDEPRSRSETLAWIDAFLQDFKRVVPTDNLGDWSALLEVTTWAQETPLVLRGYLDAAMAREWASAGRAPSDSALIDRYQVSLGNMRRIRQSRGAAAERYSPFEDFLLVDRAPDADTVAVRFLRALAGHRAVEQMKADMPYLLSLRDVRHFTSVEELYRSRAEWVPELRALVDGLLSHARGELHAASVTARFRDRMARTGAALAVVLGLIFTIRLIQQRSRLDTELRSALERDVLTGLANRYALFSAAPGRLADREWGSFALIHLDLDDFKSINDDHGHHVGDAALIAFAEALRSVVRAGHDLVCRIGGDEFVILLHRLKDPAREVEAVVQRLRERLEEPASLEGIPIRIHFTAGVAVAFEPASLEDLLVEADLALIDAKEKGRDVAQFFRRRLGRRMIHELSTALGSGELRCAFQPQIDLEAGSVVGLEALARWHREDRQQVPTRSLIDALEWLGASREWLRVAMRDIESAWKVAGGRMSGRIWLNLMGSDVEETSATELLEIFAGTRVPLNRLGVEITTPIGRASISEAVALLSTLREQGIAVALDDVGDDRVPLLHVSELPIDMVKLDRCLIRGIDSQPALRAVVQSVKDLCGRLERDVLAEGVETVEEEVVLRRIGVRYVQGFLFAKPLPISALAGFLRDRALGRTTNSVA